MRYCPICCGPSTIIETRERADGDVRRRRACKVCPARWTTIEKVLKGSIRFTPETGSGK